MAKSAQSNVLGIISLVLGIGSIIFSWFGLASLIGAVVGVILAILQKKKFKNGVATAGLITSIIGGVLSLLFLLVYVLLGSLAFLAPY